MKLNWTKGLNERDKEEMKLLFSSNARLRARAIEIMKEKQAAAHKGATLKETYDSPNWALRQADAVGYERAINEIISLFES